MKKFVRILVPVLLAGAAALPATAFAADYHEGQMIYGADGGRIAPIYHVLPNGSVQVILSGKLVTIPGAGLSVVGGKVTSAKGKADLERGA